MSGKIQRQGIGTADLLPAFDKTDGSQIDPEARSSADCDRKSDLLHGRTEDLTKLIASNGIVRRGGDIRLISTIPPCHLVGNYGNFLLRATTKRLVSRDL